jgi:hypothetical protein
VKTFVINTSPHEAAVGGDVLLFKPEVTGAEFLRAYDKLRTVQKKVMSSEGGKASSTKHAKADENVSTEVLIELNGVMIEFITFFLHDDHSRQVFGGLSLPDRVLGQMIEWIAELYGGGSGNESAGGGTS